MQKSVTRKQTVCGVWIQQQLGISSLLGSCFDLLSIVRAPTQSSLSNLKYKIFAMRVPRRSKQRDHGVKFDVALCTRTTAYVR